MTVAVTRKRVKKARTRATRIRDQTPARLAFKKAAAICKGQPLPQYRACMAREIRKIYSELKGGVA